MLGGRGSYGRGLVSLGGAASSTRSRPHVLVSGGLGVSLGHDGHVSQHLLRDSTAGVDHHHGPQGRLVLARSRVEAGLRSGVAGRHELLVRVVRVGHTARQYGVSGHLERRGQVRTTSSSSVTSSAIILPSLTSSLIGALLTSHRSVLLYVLNPWTHAGHGLAAHHVRLVTTRDEHPVVDVGKLVSHPHLTRGQGDIALTESLRETLGGHGPHAVGGSWCLGSGGSRVHTTSWS